MPPADTGSRPNRRDRQIREHIHDPYMVRLKPSGPSVCGTCGLVFAQGRWRRAEAATNAKVVSCPACQRQADNMPAGEVRISGAFAVAHHDEILALARHRVEREAIEHPLHRILRVEEGPDGYVIFTTDIHGPPGIGRALRDAHGGDVNIHYDDSGYYVRVTWRRED